MSMGRRAAAGRGGEVWYTFFPCPLDQALAASGPDSGVARASHHLAKFLTVEAQAKFATPGSVFVRSSLRLAVRFCFGPFRAAALPKPGSAISKHNVTWSVTH